MTRREVCAAARTNRPRQTRTHSLETIRAPTLVSPRGAIAQPPGPKARVRMRPGKSRDTWSEDAAYMLVVSRRLTILDLGQVDEAVCGGGREEGQARRGASERGCVHSVNCFLSIAVWGFEHAPRPPSLPSFMAVSPLRPPSLLPRARPLLPSIMPLHCPPHGRSWLLVAAV